MARTHFSPMLHQLFERVSRSEVNALSDSQLLERFAQGHEEAAFTALVQRHGPLVLGVCRRVLRHSQDAEDVFQTPFLGLARQAASIRRAGSLAGWLYRVAYRLSIKVNRMARRRLSIPLDAISEPTAGAEPWREFLAAMDEELHALPEKYRLALVLCYLEGQTRDQAARQLGWSRRTLLRRLQEGRQRMRDRLERHGITLPAALLTVALVQPARAAVPLELTRQTVRAAILLAMGSELVIEIVPAHVLGLAKGGLQTMTKFKIALALLMAFGVAGWGAGSFRHPAQAADSPPGNVKPPPAANSRPAAPRIAESVWADLASPERSRVTRALMTLGAAPPSDAVAFLKKRLHPVKDDPERTPRLIGDLDSKELAKRQVAAEELEYLGKFAVPYLKSALAAKPALEMKKRIEQILARVQPPTQFGGLGGMGGYQMMPFGGMGGGVMGGMQIIPNGGFPNGVLPNGGGVLPNGGIKPGGMGGMQLTPNGGLGGLQVRPNGGILQQIPIQPGGIFTRPSYGLSPAPAKPPAVWVRAVWAIAALEQIGSPEARLILEEMAKGAADALPTKEAKAALGRLGKR